MDLKGARILVTGGSLGIGKAAAEVLVKSGARVGITGRNGDRVASAAKEIGALGIVADAANIDDVNRTYEEFAGEFGGVDCLINNAGIGAFRKLADVEHEDFKKVFSVNVFGAAMMAKGALKYFTKQGRGHIINIGSTAGKKGFQSGTVYSASKFALRGMTQCWQAELRPQNIRVILVEPSEVATAFGKEDGVERVASPNKLTSYEIAHAIKSVLEMDDRGMIPELSVWATNPW